MLRIVIALTLFVLFASYLPVGCGTSGGGGSGTVGQTSQPAAIGVVVTAVRDLGAIPVNSMILKRDCGFSAMFGGKSVWLFGDTTLLTPSAGDCVLLSNTLSTTFDLDAGDGIDGMSERVDPVGAPAEFFPLTLEEQEYNARHAGEFCEVEPCDAHWGIWPGTIIVDKSKDWAYVFYRKVHIESGFFKFLHVGHSLAIWKDPDGPVERPVFNYVESYPTIFFSESEQLGMGSASLVMGDEAYVYGCELGEDKLTKPCHLARVAFADILDKTAWTFYSGNGLWSPDGTQAKVIFYGNDMMSVSFNPYLNRYMAVYSEPLAAKAMLRTAVKPEGPWSEPVALFTVDAPENAHGWVYDFLAHPEYSQDNGRIIYVTYTMKLDQMRSETRLMAVELDIAH
jgi:hypothetical protein